jgi:hypothetical protein
MELNRVMAAFSISSFEMGGGSFNVRTVPTGLPRLSGSAVIPHRSPIMAAMSNPLSTTTLASITETGARMGGGGSGEFITKQDLTESVSQIINGFYNAVDELIGHMPSELQVTKDETGLLRFLAPRLVSEINSMGAQGRFSVV